MSITPFSFFTASWPCLSLHTPLRDLQSLACVAKTITSDLTIGLEALLGNFFTLTLEQQAKDKEFFSKIGRLLAPYSPLCPLVRFELYRIQGLFKKAQQEVPHIDDKALGKISQDLNTYALTAKAFEALWQNNIEEACTYLDKSFSHIPQYIPTLLGLFHLFKSNNEHKKAFESIDKVLGIEPKNLHAKVLKCQIMFFGIGIKKNQKLGMGSLVSELKNCSNENPFSLHIRSLLAEFYHSIMKPRSALGELTLIVGHKEAKDCGLYFTSYLKMAKIYISKNEELEKAREYIEIGLKSEDAVDKSVAMELLSTLNAGKNTSIQKITTNGSTSAVLQNQSELDPIGQKCLNYLSLTYSEKQQTAKSIENEVQKLRMVQPSLAFCCLGESYMVQGMADEMCDCFKQLKPWVKHDLSASKTPTLLFYILSRYAYYLIQEEDSYDEGKNLIIQASECYHGDALTEFLATYMETECLDILSLEYVFHIDVTNIYVANIAVMNALQADKTTSSEVYRMLHNYFEECVLKHAYNNEYKLNLVKLKQKLPKTDKRDILQLFNEVIAHGAKEFTAEYIEAVILRAELILSSRGNYADLEQDLLAACERCSDAKLLMKAASLFKNNTKQWPNAYIYSLQTALNAIIVDRSKLPTISRFISSLYSEGGFGIIQSDEVAQVWNGFSYEKKILLNEDVFPIDLESANNPVHLSKAFLFCEDKDLGEIGSLLLKYS